jgi:uncharacterized protein YgiM (DUF1202 family)
MVMRTCQHVSKRQAIVALLAALLVGCQGPRDGLQPTVEALKATVSAQNTVIAVLEAERGAATPAPSPTRTVGHQATVSVPTPQPVSTVQRPPTATPSPLPTATPSPSATATPVPDASVGETLTNLRGGPGVGFEILSEVAAGTPLEVLGKSADGEWIRVRIPDGLEGWMFYLPVRLNISLDAVPVIQ